MSLAGLTLGTTLILYYELVHEKQQLAFIVSLYVLLTLAALLYSKRRQVG